VKVVDQLSRASRRAAAYRVAALAHLGDREAQERAVRDLKTVDPAFTVSAFLSLETYKDKAITDRLAEDLARADLPLA